LGSLEVSVGSQLAKDVYAYLAPGQIGIYLVSAVLPAEPPTGNAVQIIVRANGVESQTVTMAIQ